MAIDLELAILFVVFWNLAIISSSWFCRVPCSKDKFSSTSNVDW
jgi:hypothetical protein